VLSCFLGTTRRSIQEVSTDGQELEEINARIAAGAAVVVTAEEFASIAADEGLKTAARKVDVVTTGLSARCVRAGSS